VEKGRETMSSIALALALGGSFLICLYVFGLLIEGIIYVIEAWNNSTKDK
jgi:hypothetical protein